MAANPGATPLPPTPAELRATAQLGDQQNRSAQQPSAPVADRTGTRPDPRRKPAPQNADAEQSGRETTEFSAAQRIEQIIVDAGLDDEQVESLSFDLEAWLDASAAQSPYADALRERLTRRIAEIRSLTGDAADTTIDRNQPSEAGQIDAVVRETAAGTDIEAPADGESDAGLPEPVDFVPGTAVLVPDDPKDRARANLDVIRLLDAIDSEDRFATPDEQAVLATWSGWGAIPEVFARQAIGWDDERADAKAASGHRIIRVGGQVAPGWRT
ncbi:hypothetical protein [Nocardia terpenica]|uniref:Uncharacterized protein n=1 Tax=Nocardia terpenica TaxID=455432 RepID=A0A164PF91_9NOCA|nr:hypothetical protein [Nocardia terpenica]KZM75491.1 hypothetical protein AWN90_19110 [Nocardia terpenica]NQE85961.1 hypothetical protein [Nocardia terpenica]